jgi:hypothetical protein
MAVFSALYTQISAINVGKAINALIYAVESAPRVLFYALCSPNYLTDIKAIVSIEVNMETADNTSK